MRTSPLSVAEADTQQKARRGLAIYLVAVVLITGTFDVLILTINPLWIFGRMFSPAVASVLARLVLREGFADVSFRLGGRRTWKTMALALILPIVIGTIAYGLAWTTGLAQFDPQPSAGLGAQLASEVTSSPMAMFVIMLVLATIVWVFPQSVFAAGEEIGWRGYMLTRLIDAGVPRPVLVSVVIWGLWHMDLIFGFGYMAGPSVLLSAVLFMVWAGALGFVLARMRLETGSVWPAIVLHGAWNSITQTAFDPVSTGGVGTALWVGESGILVVVVSVVVATIYSRGRWTIRRVPEEPGEVEPAASPMPQT
jgi:membrane protease YdiL (CAAX protease family)